MPTIDRVRIEDWKQIREAEFDFHPRLTVLTGMNGTGKTSILRLLAENFNQWTPRYLRTPDLGESGDSIQYRFDWLQNLVDRKEIGAFHYNDGQKKTITLPQDKDRIDYRPKFGRPANVQGVFIPSNRNESSYQEIRNLDLRSISAGDAYNRTEKGYRKLSQGSGGNPHNALKRSLIQLGLFSYETEAIQPNPESRRLYEGFQDILKDILPGDLGFKKLRIRGSKEVVLETESGTFPIDSVSAGIGSLMLLAWQIQAFRFQEEVQAQEEYMVLIDEPDLHLHPEMQRRVLPSLVEAFPRARFVVATHSPLVVGSVEDSNAYALVFRESRVESRQLDFEAKIGSATEVLHDALGMEFTRPPWVERKLRAVADRYESPELTERELEEIREELREMGLEKWTTDAFSMVINPGGGQGGD